jgi:hypothetical protein
VGVDNGVKEEGFGLQADDEAIDAGKGETDEEVDAEGAEDGSVEGWVSEKTQRKMTMTTRSKLRLSRRPMSAGVLDEDGVSSR